MKLQCSEQACRLETQPVVALDMSGHGTLLRSIGIALGTASALLLGFTAPVRAGDTVYVSNIGEDTYARFEVDSNLGAQRFTTGSASGGYVLKGVELNLSQAPEDGTLTVTIREVNTNPATPGRVVHALTNPLIVGDDAQMFEAPANAHLDEDESYFVHIAYEQNSGDLPKFKLTDSYDQNSEIAEDGWEIQNRHFQYYNGNQGLKWYSSGAAVFKIRVLGENAPPTADDQSKTIDEDESYEFQESDFGFNDINTTTEVSGDSADSLQKVIITELPEAGKGTLTLNSTDITSVPQQVTKADLNDVDNENFTYTPPENANGDDYASFKFKVNDGDDDSTAEYTFTISVDPVNDAPTIAFISIEAGNNVNLDEDDSSPAHIFAVSDFGFQDVDEGDELVEVKITSLPGANYGRLKFDGTDIDSDDLANDEMAKTVSKADLDAGKLTYTPPANVNGFLGFQFKVNDGDADSLERFFFIKITAANDPPIVSNSNVETDEDTPRPFAVSDFGFTDVDSDTEIAQDTKLNAALESITITSLPGTGKGTLELDNQTITNLNQIVTKIQLEAGDLKYHPPLNANGTNFASFQFKANDGMDDSTNTATMTITVKEKNDAPEAEDDDFEIDANTSLNELDVLENDSDVDGDNLSVTVDTTPSHGTATVDSSGLKDVIRYSPDLNFIGTDTFNYTISDGQDPPLSDTAAVTVTVIPKLEGPDSINYLENNTATLATYSATGTPGWSLSGNDSHAFTISDTGVLTFNTPPDRETPTDDGTDNEYNITVQATVDVDGVPYIGEQDVSVTVMNVDEDPVWSGGTEFFFSENDDVDKAITITVTDPEGVAFGGAGRLYYDENGNDNDESKFDHDFINKDNNTVYEIPFSFKTSPDFEQPTDAGKNNVYDVGAQVILGNPISGPRFNRYITITVTDVNEAPVAMEDPRSINEGGSVDIDVLDNDEDQDANTTLSVIRVGTENVGTENTENEVDTEAETDPANGTATWDSINERVIYTPDEDFNGTDTFTYVVSDGELTDIGTVTVTVGPVNDAPVALDDEATTNEAESSVVPVLANDEDVDEDVLRVSAVGTGDDGPANGSIAITDSNGNIPTTDSQKTTVTYTPNAGFAGIDSFTYTVSDGQDPALTDTATVTVKVVPTVTGSAEPSYAENGTDSVATYTANGDPSWSLSGIDSEHFEIGDDGVLSFEEPPDFELLADDNGDNVYEITVEATITDVDTSVSVTGTLAVSVSVTNVTADDPLQARDDTAQTTEETGVNINVLVNDTAEDLSLLSVSHVGTVENGMAEIKSGSDTTITYTPDNNFAGIDTFTYTVSDGSDSDDATVTVKVVPTVTGSAEPSYAENGTDPVATYTANGDPSTANGDPSWSLSGVDSKLFRIGTDDGVLSFEEPPDFELLADDNGDNVYEITVEATITAGDNAVTGQRDLRVSVTDVNEQPLADDDKGSVDEDGEVIISVLDNDNDQDANTELSVIRVGTVEGESTANEIHPANGTVAITEGSTTTITYTPDGDFFGEDTFTYVVSDGQDPALTAIGTVTVTVEPKNDPPVAVTDNVTTDEGMAIDIDVLNNDRDMDPDANPNLSVIRVGTADGVDTATEINPTDGTVEIIDSGTRLTYTPKDDDFNGTDTFTYVVSDGELTAIGTVMVTVNPVNDAPVALDDEATTDEVTSVEISVLENDSDSEDNTLSVSEVQTPVNGTVSITGSDHTTITYTPNAGFAGIDTFTYTVSDGSDTVSDGSDTATVTVKVIPTVNGLAEPDYAENGTGPVATYMANGNPSWSLTGIDSEHFMIGANDGVLRFREPPDFEFPADSESEPDNIYDISVQAIITDDDNDNTVGGSKHVSVSVTDVTTVADDPPLARDDTAQTTEGTFVDIDVLANDTSQDASLSVSGVGTEENGPAKGTAVIKRGSGTSKDLVTYTPNDNFAGIDSFTYTVSDGTTTATATVTVKVAPTVSVLATVGTAEAPLYAENGTGSVATYTAAGNPNPSWSLSGPDSDRFMIDTVDRNLHLHFKQPPDFEKPTDTDADNVYEIMLAASADAVTGTPLSVSVRVTDENEDPVAMDLTASTDDGMPVVIDVLADNGMDQDGDNLSVTGVGTANGGNTTGTEIDPDNGTVAITDNGTTVTYTPDQDFVGIETFTYTISDGTNSASGRVTVEVTPTVTGSADPSHVENDTEDVATYMVNGGSPSWSLSGDDSNHFSIGTADGILRFREPPDFEFPLDADRNNIYAITVEATVTVNNVPLTGRQDVSVSVSNQASSNDDMPVPRDDESSVAKDTAIDIDVLANDSANLAATLRLSRVGTPANGVAVITRGSGNTNDLVTYTPNPDFLGIDSFSYTVHDGTNSASGMVTVEVMPTVTGSAAPSYAENGTDDVATYMVNGESPSWSLSGVDSEHFTIDANNGVLRFREPPDYERPTDFDEDNDYVVTLEASVNGATGRLNVSVSVSDINEAPLAKPDTVRIDEDMAAVTIDVLANDTDPDQDANPNLRLIGVGTADGVARGNRIDTTNGTVAITGNDTRLTYRPDDNFQGNDTFTYTVSDGELTAIGTVTVTVRGTNDRPMGGHGKVETDEDNEYDFRLDDFSYSDIESQPLSAVKITRLPRTDKGTLKLDTVDISGSDLPKTVTRDDITAGRFSYAPPTDVYGDDYASFRFKVNDGTSDSDLQYNMSIDVKKVNDRPTAEDGEVETTEDNERVFALSDFNYSDIESEPLSTVTITELPLPDRGTLMLDGVDITELPGTVSRDDITTGKLTYTPPANANGDDYASFKFKVNDGTDDSESEYTMGIDIDPRNDKPMGQDGTVTTDKNTAYSFAVADFGFMDVDADTTINQHPDSMLNATLVHVKITSLAGEGSLSLDGQELDPGAISDSDPVELSKEQLDDGLLVYTPPADGLGSPLATFSFKVNDGELDSEAQTISIDVEDIVDNADLKQLAFPQSDVDFDRDFDPAISDYNVKVPSGVERLTLALTTDDNGATATVMVDGEPLTSESTSFAIPLAEGRKTILSITVTAEDGTTTRTYTITLVPPWAHVTGTPLPSLTLYVGEDPEPVNADPAIDGDDLTWRFESSDPAVASVPEEASDNATVLVTPVREGEATITAMAENADGASLPVTFAVSVRTSAAEKEAIRASLSGQARVLLGSVTDIIGARLGGSSDAGTGPGSSCHSASAPAAGSGGVNGISGVSHGDSRDQLIASDSWQAESWNTDLAGMGLGGVPHVGHQGDASMDRTFDDLLELFRGRPHSLHPADWTGDCGNDAVGDLGRSWTLWGATDLQWASGSTDNSDFDGWWQLFYLGADRSFGERWTGGISLSQVQGEVDYSFGDGTVSGDGQLSSSLSAVYPYVHGQLSSNLELWAIGGIGFGEVENEREHVDGHRDRGDLDMGLAAVGLRRSLSKVGSTMDLALSGDAGFVNLSAEGDGSLDGAEASIGRFRLGLELSRPFASGVEPFAQLHGRYDSGDGPTGAAGEMVVGLRYDAERFNLELRGNHLTSAADFEQWGANARLDYGPATDGTGFNMGLTSQWGAAENGGSFLDGHSMELPTPVLVSAQGDSVPAEISGEIGYSLSMGQQWGTITPNLGYDHSGNGSSRSRIGLAYAISSDLGRDIELRLDLARRERRQEDPDHSIELGASLRF